MFPFIMKNFTRNILNQLNYAEILQIYRIPGKKKRNDTDAI